MRVAWRQRRHPRGATCSPCPASSRQGRLNACDVGQRQATAASSSVVFRPEVAFPPCGLGGQPTGWGRKRTGSGCSGWWAPQGRPPASPRRVRPTPPPAALRSRRPRKLPHPRPTADGRGSCACPRPAAAGAASAAVCKAARRGRLPGRHPPDILPTPPVCLPKAVVAAPGADLSTGGRSRGRKRRGRSRQNGGGTGGGQTPLLAPTPRASSGRDRTMGPRVRPWGGRRGGGRPRCCKWLTGYIGGSSGTGGGGRMDGRGRGIGACGGDMWWEARCALRGSGCGGQLK